MTSTSGKLPLHRRFDQKLTLEQIRNRYRKFGPAIRPQVEELQVDTAFREYCHRLYERGYKDWMILLAIFNTMLNWRLASEGASLASISGPAPIDAHLMLAPWNTFPVADFLKPDALDAQLKVQMFSSMKAYGFELRRSDISMDAVEKFLRERMNHFTIDIEHEPLFGTPPGKWPNV